MGGAIATTASLLPRRFVLDHLNELHSALTGKIPAPSPRLTIDKFLAESNIHYHRLILGGNEIFHSRVDSPTSPRFQRTPWWLILAAFGPGIMVMLADTDAGSIVTAAQSGAVWGYAMVLPQLLLIPMVYLVQEITIRLALGTGKGHGELIRERFGNHWAIVSVSTLFLSGLGSLVTEFSGIAGVGMLFGIRPFVSVPFATVLLVVLGLSGSYRKIERIGIAVGLMELCMIPAAIAAHPHVSQFLHGLETVPVGRPS
jgi:Mn2+/Fe2+ NRAMP family transporter